MLNKSKRIFDFHVVLFYYSLSLFSLSPLRGREREDSEKLTRCRLKELNCGDSGL